MLNISMNWSGGMKFEGISNYGHPITTDASIAGGGREEGYMPTELILYGIAGCTGIDVIRILEKKRQKVESLEITVKAHQNEDYPKPFHTFEVHFRLEGDLDERKVAQAIELSEGKYCVVSQSLEQPATVKTSFSIESPS